MAVFIARVDKGIRNSLERIIHRFLNPDDLNRGVFLKPNIVFPVKDRSGEITRRVVVEQIILILRAMKRDVDIVIGEGVAAGADAQENFKISGYTDLAKKLGVLLFDLESVERTEVDWKYGKLSLPVMAFNRIYISLPVLKLNSAAGISGAMKNQKGLVCSALKKQFHRMGLHEQLVELNKIIQPYLTIVDCARYFKGPLFAAGTGTVELDSYIINLLGIASPENVRLAREQFSIPKQITAEGDAPHHPRSRHQNANRSFRRFLRLRIWAGAGACSMCRRRLTEIKSPTVLLSRSGLLTALKLISYMVTGADIIVGSDAQSVRGSRRLICFGDCTRLIAQDGGYIYIPGCPPHNKDIAGTK
jgi:uncharacterized protein (DUF362 family)